ncbi:MAG: CatB-related O-acetyltransferase [Planctomycetes bacterium]|nr:CatB-related O-acetyltransferase [Planctomycetota bacterium]
MQALGANVRKFILKHRISFRSLKRGRVRDHFPVGRGTYGEPTVQFHNAANLRIGSFCSIADNVNIFLGGNHRIDWITAYPFNVFRASARHIKGQPQTKGDVTIGNDVWIGDGVTILSGVTIGNGAAIGAKAVIAKDVPPYALVAGNPARILRYRFPEHQIAELQRIAWWNWSDAKQEMAMPILLSGDVEKLILFADSHRHID